MKRLFVLVAATAALATAAVVVAPGGGAQGTAPNPVTCEGYPEPRVYLEGQSWWEPQNGPDTHPGTGEQGHVHVEGCFPLYQNLTGPSLELDLTVRLHNMPGYLDTLRVRSYSVDEAVSVTRGGKDGDRLNYRCVTADCSYQFHMSLPLDKAVYSGTHAIQVEASVVHEPGADGLRGRQITLPQWGVNFANGKPPVPGTVGVIERVKRDVIGDTQYTYLKESYSRASLLRDSLPFNEATLAQEPKSGVWEPKVFFEKDSGFVYVDPKLHADPRDKGLVVYEGVGNTPAPDYGVRRVQVDTTKLTDGPHRLLVGSCNVNVPETAAGVAGGDPNSTTFSRGDHCGTVVIPFTVDNGVVDPPPPPPPEDCVPVEHG